MLVLPHEHNVRLFTERVQLVQLFLTKRFNVGSIHRDFGDIWCI